IFWPTVCAERLSGRTGWSQAIVRTPGQYGTPVNRGDAFPRRRRHSLDLLLLTSDPQADTVLPSLSLLPHAVRTAMMDVSSLLEAGSTDIAIIDARKDLAAARSLCKLLGTAGPSTPVVTVISEGGLVAVSADWGIDDILLP